MNKQEFYQRLAEILDTEEVKPEDTLKQLDGWDSPPFSRCWLWPIQSMARPSRRMKSARW